MSESARAGASGGYYPQINSLRLLAILLVFGWHWARPMMAPIGLDGGYGVWLFFTISGYLITDILLRNRDAIDAGSLTVRRALGVFYARRSLRIFPVYYVFLGICLLAGLLPLGESIWYFTYLANFRFAAQGDFGPQGHLWSLAVEEQFYLIWPLLVFVTPVRRLPTVILAGLAIALLYRIAATTFDWGVALHLIPLSCLDTLGIGALLAWYRRSPAHAGLVRKLRVAGPVGVLLLLAVGFAPHDPRNVLAPLLVGLTGAWLVNACVEGVRGPIGKILSFGPFLYLGQISYGLYLYHGLAPALIGDGFGAGLGLGYWLGMVVTVTARTLLVIAIASLSWFVFERPLNELKRFWTVAPARSDPAQGSGDPVAGVAKDRRRAV